MQKLASKRFREVFGSSPNLWTKAPGQINLFGLTSVPSSGLTLSFALDLYLEMAVSPSTGGDSVLAIDSGELLEIGKNTGHHGEPGHWSSLLLKVIDSFHSQRQPVPSIQAAFTGSLPLSASLNAPAALASALALALDHLAGTHLTALEMARLCGMPQMLPILIAKHECALKLDWQAKEHFSLPLRLNPYRLMLSLAPLQTRSEPAIPAEAEIAKALYEAAETRHILEAEKCILASDLNRFGRLLNESAKSKMRLWKTVPPECQTLMDLTSANLGVVGGSFIGEGSEAAVLSLVHRDSVEEFTDSVKYGFRREFGREPLLIDCMPSDGASFSEGPEGVAIHPGWAAGGTRTANPG